MLTCSSEKLFNASRYTGDVTIHMLDGDVILQEEGNELVIIQINEHDIKAEEAPYSTEEMVSASSDVTLPDVIDAKIKVEYASEIVQVC